MPHSYACYAPPPYMPEVGPLPAASAGRMTFGSLSNPAKFSPRLLDAWAAILERVPRSQLLLKFGGLDEPQVQRRIHERFARRGIESARVLLEGNAPHPELLAAYQRIDIALDTQPYSGGVTTCEALWMGVPVVTYPGPTFAGRPTVSHLTNVGLEQFIGGNAKEYVDLAVTWASRVEELAAIRAEMRERVRKSPLYDAPGFAADFLEIVRQAWVSRITAAS
jgi:predicted O-linked N-acetylglucosamine transferase (SPINDLY family)